MNTYEPKGPPKATLMIVEDDEIQNAGLSLSMANEGFRIVAFSDLAEAKTYQKEHAKEMSLVVCDGSLQRRYDGIEWAGKLHAAGYNVALCAAISYTGKIPFLPKPFTDPTFLRFIERLLDQAIP